MRRKALKGYSKETFASRAEWLKARGFGGSSASSILGVNPWMTAMDLYLKSVGQPIDEEKENTSAMNYGTEAERLVRAIYALDGEYLGWKVKGPGNRHAMYRRKDKPYLTATIDGQIEEAGRKGILEIKTHDMRGRADEKQWEEGQLPQNYYVQCLHYLMVMGDMEFAVLVAKLRYFDYDGESRKLARTEFRYYRIEREEKQAEIDFLEKAETDFYENHVAKRVPPNITIEL